MLTKKPWANKAQSFFKKVVEAFSEHVVCIETIMLGAKKALS